MDVSATASIQIFNGEVTGNTGVMAHMIAEAYWDYQKNRKGKTIHETKNKTQGKDEN